MSLRILHTNDMHGVLEPQRIARLRDWRAECDLYLDSGDAIKTGNLGTPLRPEPAWSVLESLQCDASVLGNRETHPLTPFFEAKLSGSSHPILCANLRKKDGSRPLPGHVILTANNLRIGVIGVMVPMVTERMKTQIASAYLWDPPIPVALELARKISADVDVVFALTHIGYRQDIELAKQGGFQAIFGGHSHTVIEKPEKVGNTWIAQGGSHSRFAGVYEWDGALRGCLHPLEALKKQPVE